MQPLASAHLPHKMRFFDDFMAAHILSITRRMPAIDRLAIHLSQQDVGNGAHHRVRRAFQQIGQPHQKPTLAQANGVVNVGKGKKLDLQLRQRSPRTQLAVFFMEDFEQSLTHSEPRLAQAQIRTLHSGRLTDCFVSDFLRCFAASSCSTSSLRWSSTDVSTVSSAVVSVNSYCLASAAATPAASRSARSLAWNSVSASMTIFKGFRMSF